MLLFIEKLFIDVSFLLGGKGASFYQLWVGAEHHASRFNLVCSNVSHSGNIALEISKQYKVGLFSLGSLEMNLSAKASHCQNIGWWRITVFVLSSDTRSQQESLRAFILLTAGQKNALSWADKRRAKLK